MAKKEKYIAVREVYTYNKRFKQGDEFPVDWLKEGYLPNHHFMPEDEAKEFMRDSTANKPIQCAGDDPRSTKELKEALLKYTNVLEKWGRKEIWTQLHRFESGEAKTLQPSEKAKK